VCGLRAPDLSGGAFRRELTPRNDVDLGRGDGASSSCAHVVAVGESSRRLPLVRAAADLFLSASSGSWHVDLARHAGDDSALFGSAEGRGFVSMQL
jgi:hypothetical protein